MTLKEKITQVIVDLNKESIKYPRMKTNDVTFMLAKLINDYHESDNNGWIKIESESDLPKTPDFYWCRDNNGAIHQIYYEDITVGYSTHYQPIVKPREPLY